MLYVHENNIRSKISSNYRGKKAVLEAFLNDVYLPMRSSILALTFDGKDPTVFNTAATIINTYYDSIEKFSTLHGITSQSKFSSTFLEEISCYLFKDLPEIKNNTFGIFNKGIYAGLKIDNKRRIAIIKKDVDFCIGKKANITIDTQPPVELILPVVAVEVKTYLDATMFGEIKSSSKAIRSASPNSKTYVLMGYKSLADEHIIAARQDSTLSEMFALKEEEHSPISASVLHDYWEEISTVVNKCSKSVSIPSSGRLLNL